jgi:ABC-2 type transport system permease protein
MKILKHNKFVFAIYLIIFVGLSLLFTNSASENDVSNFTETKIQMGVVLEDPTPLTQGLLDYLNKIGTVTLYSDENDELQDAFFFRQVQYVLKIPKGFTEDFINNQSKVLEKIVVPDATNAFYADMMIDQYLNTARTYVDVLEIKDPQALADKVQKDLDVDTSVTLKNFGGSDTDFSGYLFYFNFLGYALFSIIILGVSFTMIIYHDSDLRNRNAVSPLSRTKAAKHHILANASFALAVAIVFIISIFVFMKFEFYENLWLLVLNVLIFTISVLAISFFIGLMVKSKNAIYAVVNVVALGSSFLSGVFVPQQFLSETILRVSSFFPVYWFVKVNHEVQNMGQWTLDNLKSPLIGMGIQLLFALMFFSLAIVIARRKWGQQKSLT